MAIKMDSSSTQPITTAVLFQFPTRRLAGVAEGRRWRNRKACEASGGNGLAIDVNGSCLPPICESRVQLTDFPMYALSIRWQRMLQRRQAGQVVPLRLHDRDQRVYDSGGDTTIRVVSPHGAIWIRPRSRPTNMTSGVDQNPISKSRVGKTLPPEERPEPRCPTKPACDPSRCRTSLPVDLRPVESYPPLPVVLPTGSATSHHSSRDQSCTPTNSSRAQTWQPGLTRPR